MTFKFGKRGEAHATGPKMMATLSYVEVVVLPVAGIVDREVVDVK